MSMNLMLALSAEHKARTGHDVWNASPLSTLHLTCDVCLFLSAERRAIESEAYESAESPA